MPAPSHNCYLRIFYNVLARYWRYLVSHVTWPYNWRLIIWRINDNDKLQKSWSNNSNSRKYIVSMNCQYTNLKAISLLYRFLMNFFYFYSLCWWDWLKSTLELKKKTMKYIINNKEKLSTRVRIRLYDVDTMLLYTAFL